MAIRYDRYAIKAEKTDEGFIRDAPVIGRVGILKYRNPDGSTRYEYRPPDEAFNADSLATLKGKPITVGHHGMVSDKTWNRSLPVGTVMSEGRQDGDNIRADMVIYNLPTKARELSCGYTCDLDMTPGTAPDGQHYDAIQRNIRYNHLAIVNRARAGSVARLNMDGDEVFEEDKEEKRMADNLTKIRLDSGIEYDTAPEVKVAYEKAQTEIKEQQSKMDGLQAKYDTLLANSEKAKKTHEDELAKAKENFDSAVKARVELLEVAKKFGIEKADEMSEKDIKTAVIKKVHGDGLNLDGKSEDYVNACYDLAKTQETKHEDSMVEPRGKNSPLFNRKILLLYPLNRTTFSCLWLFCCLHGISRNNNSLKFPCWQQNKVPIRRNWHRNRYQQLLNRKYQNHKGCHAMQTG